ncbi:MAG: VCBS repeat-containing protein [Bacteroidota bacterium]
MAKDNNSSKKQNKGLKNFIPAALILFVFAGIPMLFLNYQAKRNGMTWGGVIHRIMNKAGEKDKVSGVLSDNTAGEKINFLDPILIGDGFIEPPLISNVAIADLDRDGLPDVIVCDCRSNTVSWIRQYPAGTYTETVLASDLIAPAHVQVIDFDKDGDNDIMVAVLGLLFPSNDKIGSVIILENDGSYRFKKHVIAAKIARVSDVRAGDLDGDGDMDLAVAQFGYDDGETRWIENLGNWEFKSHNLQHLSGPINVEIVDIDKDGDLDIISLVSQEWEEIYVYLNDGKGNFQPKLIFGSSNEDFGSSGIYMCDLDQDGDQDILYTNGDAFDYIPPQGRPWHGVQWLENKGNLNFEFHRICNFTGAYNARPVDIDGDGDLDIFAVSAFNLWDKPESLSFIWLENNGKQQFTRHDITNNPTHLITLELGDFNNDGLMDMVTGGMHAYPPYDRMSRVALWMNNGELSGKK